MPHTAIAAGEFVMFRIVGFVSAVAGLPLLAQIKPVTEAGQLGTGTAQVVLSIVVIGLAASLVKVFFMYRSDMREANTEMRKYMQTESTNLQDLVAKNTTAIDSSTKATEEQNRTSANLSQNVAVLTARLESDV